MILKRLKEGKKKENKQNIINNNQSKITQFTMMNVKKDNNMLPREFAGKTFYKFINPNMRHYNYVYRDNYNKLPDNEQFDPYSECGGGFHFCTMEDLPKWMYMFSSKCMIYEVTLLDNARVCKKVKKYKSDSIVISNPLSIRDFIKLHDVAKLFVTLYGPSLKYIDQTNELCMIAVQQDGYSLKYVKNQTEEICTMAIEQYAHSLKYVHNQSDELCTKAIEHNIHALQYVHNQTYEHCIYAVGLDGYTLNYVQPEKRTYELYLLAVQTYGSIIQHIEPNERSKYYTDELLISALKQNGMALEFIDPMKCTNEMYMVALKQNGLALQFIDPLKHTDEMFKQAVKQNGSALQFMKPIMQTPELKIMAIKQKNK